MGRIKILDDITVQKIAAGEVVERPASIVKELIENSLDANSRNIVIEIKNGGKSYIRVTDDGDGILSEDIENAFKKHSTSKLNTIDDLYKITSLGFRGEALSSISTVAKVEIITKTKNSNGGVQAEVDESKIISRNLVGAPRGTTMIVKNLFYNLPVREKFLKSNRIETNRITEIIYKIALGNPNHTFRYINDGKVILTTSKNSDFKNHIYSILGSDFAKNLIAIEYKNEEFSIKGYISNNKLYRANRSHQYLYINGRYIDNKDISRNIEKIYRSIIPLNRFPSYILFLDIDPSKIDVNIHPTKQEIKFSNHETILNTIIETVDKKLNDNIFIPKANFQRNKNNKNEEIEDIPMLFDLDKKNRQTNSSKEDTIVIRDLRDNHIGLNEDIYIKETGRKLYSKKELQEIKNDNINEKNYNEDNEINVKETLDNIKPIGVIFSTYILAEDKLNGKFYFIDQHAAHERVMYERYLNEFKNESINIQQLIAPEIIELTSNEISKLENNKKIFIKLGFELDVFGNNSIIIRGVPIIFGHPDIKDLFMDVLDNIDIEPSSSYDLRVEKIMKIACVNSIKSGDNMEEKEMLALFEQLKQCENPHSCPHGRPTMIEMSKRDIEKEFLRTL